jgi:hypothetical protein
MMKNAPLTIRYTFILFGLLDASSLVYWLLNGGGNVPFLVLLAIQLMLLYGIAKKLLWARDLLSLVYLCFLPFTLVLSASILQETRFLSRLFIPVLLLWLPYMALIPLYHRRASTWFGQGDTQENFASIHPIAQIALILFSFGLGFIALMIEAKLAIPFLNAQQLSHIDSRTTKQMLFHLFASTGLMFAWAMTLIPSAFVLGLWKRYDLVITTRLFVLGIAFSLIFRDVSFKHLDVTLLLLFAVHLLFAALLIFASLSYARRLKRPRL